MVVAVLVLVNFCKSGILLSYYEVEERKGGDCKDNDPRKQR